MCEFTNATSAPTKNDICQSLHNAHVLAGLLVEDKAVAADADGTALRRNWYKSGISHSSTANTFRELFHQNDKPK